MKFENKIKYTCVKEALVRWVLGTDGQDGGTCEVLGTIPWGEEIESVIPWEDVSEEIDECIGSRTDENNKWWDAGVILTNKDEFERFDKFITEKTNKIMIAYQGIIDKANRLCNTKFGIVVSKFIGVEKNEAQYKPIFHYYGNNLTALANKVYNELKVSDWENDDFIDSVHYDFYNKSSTAFKSNHIDAICHLDVIKNS
jgi:hypothetical protein